MSSTFYFFLYQINNRIVQDITKLPQPAFFVYVREYPTDAIGVSGIPLSQQVPNAVTPPK